jgi:putative DNA primase/helicase
LNYTKLGLFVLPLHTPLNGKCSCGDFNCSSIGKHPRTRHGVKDATTDKAVIKKWWEQWPEANIGIATGLSSNIIVFDFDFPKEGRKSFKEIQRKNGGSFKTPMVKTGNGIHLYFKHPGVEIRNRAGILPGWDVRADGGYVVAPPSLHANGKRYKWIRG